MEKKRTPKEALDVAENLKDKPAVSALILFGSQATGKNKPSSDADIAIILKETNKDTEAEIGSTYSPDIDLTLFHRLPLYIQYEVFKKGKPIYVKDKKHLKGIKLKTLTDYQEMHNTYEQRKKQVMAK